MTSRYPESDGEAVLLPLPPILPCFAIPPLDDRPQDPIVQVGTSNTGTHHFNTDADLGSPTVPPLTDLAQQKVTSTPNLLWGSAVLYPYSLDKTFSWDGTLPHSDQDNISFPFLSEQPSLSYDLVQQQILSQPNESDVTTIRVSEAELLDNLRLIVLGSSSHLCVWDGSAELFKCRGPSKDCSTALMIEGMNEVMSASYLERFLNLGSLIRRIELFVCGIRDRQNNTTVHAFAHGLDTLLRFLRYKMSDGLLFKNPAFRLSDGLATIWLYHVEWKNIVNAIASLCSRSIDISPANYPESSLAPVELLTLIYQNLDRHLQLKSPRPVVAAVAYILTISSRPYIQHLCYWVAYGSNNRPCSCLDDKLPHLDALAVIDREEKAWQDDANLDTDVDFPAFISVELANCLRIAHRSLKLLEAAHPNHPILTTKTAEEISWLWLEEEIWRASDGTQRTTSELPSFGVEHSLPRVSDNPVSVIEDFKIFDLEPGTLSANNIEDCDTLSALHTFISSFPDSLPTISPNLASLCELVFLPLQTHSSSLSAALLSVFLDRTSFLDIDAHLLLLCSHMLLTSHSFKSRLSAALFSDADGIYSHVMKHHFHRFQPETTPVWGRSGARRWTAGLAPFLTDRGTWPPGGSELGFLLRTVIIDAQKHGHQQKEGFELRSEGMQRVIDETEFRLGFAVRDLPTGTGRERWLNPLAIEALDFLYLDYKVPHPLDVLIPHTVLSKYQRVFALLLRLMRVEAAMRFVFRLTCAPSHSLFKTLSNSNRLLWHFRFVAFSFINTLSTYFYDVAIQGNFNSLLARIAICRESEAWNNPREFQDVFALAQCHSLVLDDILSACLLRSSQKLASDALRGAMQIVLKFCILVGDLKDAQLEPRQAAATLESLYGNFREKVSTLVKTLEVLLAKDPKSQQGVELLVSVGTENEHRAPPGGTESLRHLLSRLDLSQWWATWEVS